MEFKMIRNMIIAVLILFVTGIGAFKLIGTNDSGYYQVKQSFPSGQMSVISKAGIYPKMMAKMEEYRVSDTYYFSTSDLDGGDGAEADPINVRFSGGGTADISGSVKYKLPVSEDMRLMLHEDFRSDAAIQQDLIRQYVQEVLKNTATLYKPEQTYSGGRGEFVATFQAQLEQGIYRTKSRQVITTDADGNELTETIVEIIRDGAGNPIIDKISPFVTYNVSLLQVSLKDIDYDDKVDELIRAKQEAEQQKVLAKAAAEKARQDAITAQEEGKARVAQAEADALVEKETAIVQAERDKEVAELEAEKLLRVAEFERQAAEEKAAAMLVEKEAEAKANKLLVTAGLTPLQKAEIDKETAIGVARELAKMNVPQIIQGGSDGGSGSMLDYLGVNQALDIIERLEKANK